MLIQLCTELKLSYQDDTVNYQNSIPHMIVKTCNKLNSVVQSFQTEIVEDIQRIYDKMSQVETLINE